MREHPFGPPPADPDPPHVADLVKPSRTTQAIGTELAEVDAALEKIVTDARALASAIESGTATPGQTQALDQLRAGYESRIGRRAELLTERANAIGWDERERRHEYLARLAKDPRHVEGPFVAPNVRTKMDAPNSPAEARTNALRAIEGLPLTPAAQDRLDRVVRDEDDQAAAGARYLAAVSNPDYERAFYAALRSPQYAHLDMSPAELDAMRAVRQAMNLRAAGNIGSIGGNGGADGGFGVPATLDPTIINTAALGDSGPLRRLARGITVGTNVWKGVSAGAITSGYAAELANAAIGTPTYAQPTATLAKWQSWLPYSIELGQDYPRFGQELLRLLAAALRSDEAEGFVNGDGSDAPLGIVHAIVDDTTSVVDSTAANALTVPDDAYLLQAALPARFQPNATFLANGAIVNTLFQTPPATDRPIITDDRSTMLGKPLVEIPEMDSTTVTGKAMVCYGDIREAFVIVDRIGMSVLPVPVLFDQATGLPKGESGLYAYARNTSTVVNFAAVRLLVSKA